MGCQHQISESVSLQTHTHTHTLKDSATERYTVSQSLTFYASLGCVHHGEEVMLTDALYDPLKQHPHNFIWICTKLSRECFHFAFIFTKIKMKNP